jgi:hypothetical protein
VKEEATRLAEIRRMKAEVRRGRAGGSGDGKRMRGL